MKFTSKHLIWLLLCIITGMVFLVYAAASLAAGRGEILLPLDDVYIHFQYARQLAIGQPYVYNPGQPPTSGATSFLYPYILAIGYLLGFQGLNLGLWTMIVGALALLGSLWLVYWLVRAFDGPDWLAVMVALIFGLTGAVQWHFMSGMETGLMMLLALATLYAVLTDRLRLFVIVASLLALMRPEGGILSTIAVIIVGKHHGVSAQKRPRLLLLIPILVLGVQPLVNLLVTGSVVASGNSAKSIFGMVPFYWDVVIGRIWENFSRMWVEFMIGLSLREGLYIPYLIGPLALVALVISLIRRERWPIAVMLVLWLLAGTAAIATLDTAFWHFKRYQMPLIVLLYPLAGWVLVMIFQRKDAKAQRNDVGTRHVVSTPRVLFVAVGMGLIFTLSTTTAFLHHFALNVNYVYLQPLQMARWLQANTPEDALIAVHDVGVIRYVGGRNTLDMVGLTTPGAAAYWRNGPGSIAEFLIQNRPDYIASYGKGHGFGLGMIAETSIYGDPLAEFPVVMDDHFNVALAADYQGIYQPDWDSSVFDRLDYSLQSFDYAFNTFQGKLSMCFGCGRLNVSNIKSEGDSNYAWTNNSYVQGFATEVFEVDYVACPLDVCKRIEAARRVNGEETFSLQTGYDSARYWDIVLVTRLQPVSAGTLDIYANGALMGTRWIPAIPGKWLEIATFIPVEVGAMNYNSSNRIDFRIVSHMVDGPYMPAYHWLRGAVHERGRPETEIASYQNGAFILSDILIDQPTDGQQLELNLKWYSDGSAQGDYRFFVHLYDDISQPPIAQHDDYPGNGTLPPGNWLPGVLNDTVVVDLNSVSPGTYQLAIGFYDPYTGERLMPESEVYEVSPDGRLFLGEVEVPEREG